MAQRASEAISGVDDVQRNAAGMIVVQEIVLNNGGLHAVAVDARSAADPVVVNDVVFDQGAGNESGAALTQIAVHVNAIPIIPKDGVSPNDGINAGIGNVNAVLNLGIGSDVVLDQHPVFVAGENAPVAAVVGGVVLDNHALGIGDAVGDGPDAGARDRAPAGILHVEALHRDVARAFQVDAVGGVGISRVDDDAGLSVPDNRRAGRAVLGKIPAHRKAGVGPGLHGDHVARHQLIGGVLQGQPGSRAGAGVRVLSRG